MKFESVPPITPRPGRSTPRTAKSAHVWEVLVPRLLHPARLAILEALLRVGEPLSATELAMMLDDPDYTHGLLSYHLGVMAKEGVVVLVGRRSVRGATELFYYFPSPAEESNCSRTGTGATP